MENMENEEVSKESKEEKESTLMPKTDQKEDSQEKGKKSQKKYALLTAAALISVLIVGGAVFYVKKTSNPLAFTADTVVATVNGEKITKAEYDIVFQQLLPQMEQSGLSNNAEYLAKVKTDILNGLVNDKLLLQNAKKSDIAVTEDDLKKEIEAITARVGGEEKLKALMLKEGTTEKKLKSDLTNQLLVQKYLFKNIDFNSPSVTEEEIKIFYDNASQGQENVPSIESVSSQIKDQILKDKRQKLLSDFLEKLKASADINILNF